MSRQSDDRRKVRTVYQGRVQGVGFRYTTATIASNFSVTGYVKNLADGTVELVVEGPAETVDDFLQEIQTAFEHNIQASTTSEMVPDNADGEFRVRY